MILIESSIQAKFGRALRQRALSVFLREAARAAKLEGDVSVLLTGDEEIRRLNREFRGKDQATDVLSFPVLRHRARGAHRDARGLAGDLAISVETAAGQAKDAGHSLFVELQILVLHGVLHLAGYDHEKDRGEMARKEAALRKRFGLGMGLIERSISPTSAANPPDRAKSRAIRVGHPRPGRRGR
jgi:probable rRNA maturation factor